MKSLLRTLDRLSRPRRLFDKCAIRSRGVSCVCKGSPKPIRRSRKLLQAILQLELRTFRISFRVFLQVGTNCSYRRTRKGF
jgi:hypothetical protein